MSNKRSASVRLATFNTECYSQAWPDRGRSRCTRSSVFGNDRLRTTDLSAPQMRRKAIHLGVGMLMGFEWLGLGLVLSRRKTHDSARRPSDCISRSSAKDCS